MIVLASWDDGGAADVKMAELMAKYNINATFYWPSRLGQHKNTGRCNHWLTQSECKEVASKFRIGSHSATHQFMKKMSIEAICMEINESRKELQDLTGQAIDTFAYPKNSLCPMVKCFLPAAGYKDARTQVVGLLTNPFNDPYQTPCTVQIGIDRIEYNNICWEMFAREMLAKAQEQPDSVFHMFGHSHEIEEFNDWEPLEELLKLLTQ